MLDWIWCFDVKHHKARVFGAEKRDLSFTSITAKQKSSAIFGIAVSVRKVNKISRGSETYG